MKKFMKKFISVLLVLIFALGCFSGCANTAEEKNMLKGEFFNAFLNYFNISPEGATLEEMNDLQNYDLETAAIVARGLLTSEEANENITKAITKETAVVTCLNFVPYRKTGNIDDIKDADLCDHPQEIADAVATGIIGLEKGYINGDEKMTYAECQELLKNTMQAIIDGKVEDEDSVISYAPDDAIAFSAADLGEDDYITSESETDGETADDVVFENHSDAAEGSVAIGNMNLAYSDNNVAEIANTAAPYAPKYDTKTVSANVYFSKFKNAKEGDYIIYTGNTDITPIYGGQIAQFTTNKPSLNADDLKVWAGYFVSAREVKQYDGTSRYAIKYRVAEDEEIMANSKISRTETIKNIDFDPINLNVSGFQITIKPRSSNDGVDAVVSKQFSFSEEKYNNWRDQQVNPTLSFTASISQMSITTQNLQDFFKDGKQGGSVKIQYTTSEEFELETGLLRYAPDDNRKASFWTNFTKNSRFTSGKGAEAVNINHPIKIPLGNTGLSIWIQFKLCIQYDGKLTVKFEQPDNGFLLRKVNGKLDLTPLEAENKKEATGTSNVRVSVKGIVSLHCKLLRTPILSGYIEAGVDIVSIFSVYHEEEQKLETNLVADIVEAERYAPETGLKYCFNVRGCPFIGAGLQDKNLIAKIFNIKLSKYQFEISFEDYPIIDLHLEETGMVDKCTRHDVEIKESQKDLDKQAKSEGKFILNTTKVHMVDKTCTNVYLIGRPISDEKIDKNYVKGIQLKVRDKSIVEAKYDEKTNTIMLTTVNPGSTEVDVYLQKDKITGKEYVQTFSVTVSENRDVEYSSFEPVDYAGVSSIKL